MDKNKVREEIINNSSAKAFSSNAKRKILSIVCAMMFSLTIMGVGVVAALSQFDVTIGNAISVQVLNVEAGLYAKRVGGVDPADGEEGKAKNYNTGNAFFNNPVYTSADGVNEEEMAKLQEPVNVNQNSTSIKYVFMLKTDTTANANTKVKIYTISETYTHSGYQEAEISYKYCFTSQEPSDWSCAQDFTTSEVIRDNDVIIEQVVEGTTLYVPADTTVFIMAEFKLKDKPNLSIGDDGASPLMWDFEIVFEGNAEAKTLHLIEYNKNTVDAVVGMPLTQSKYNDDAVLIASYQPSREGYTFVGWATSFDGEVEYLPGDFYAGQSIVLYAVWIRHTITFTANGGNFASGATQKLYYAPHEGKIVGSVEVPTREGYSFTGWYTNSTFNLS